MAVLSHRFPEIDLHDDVRTLQALPEDTTLVVAGFPCQDLSQAGTTKGLAGSRSGLVGEVFRLIEAHRTPWLLLENVPFMLQLGRGEAMNVITERLEELGYRWAYRVVDSRAFRLPQRRRRIYLVASLECDPRHVLLADEAGPQPEPVLNGHPVACGFYWTEGRRGLGWAVDAVPTLKGVDDRNPLAPAIWMPDGRMVTPDIRDAERLQGFPAGWTSAAETVAKKGARWKLVGNAVSVPAAAWLGRRLRKPGRLLDLGDLANGEQPPLADRCCNVGMGRVGVAASDGLLQRAAPPLEAFSSTSRFRSPQERLVAFSVGRARRSCGSRRASWPRSRATWSALGSEEQTDRSRSGIAIVQEPDLRASHDDGGEVERMAQCVGQARRRSSLVQHMLRDSGIRFDVLPQLGPVGTGKFGCGDVLPALCRQH